MKKSLSILLCLACLCSLQAQHLWKPIPCEAFWLGASPNPFFLGASSNGDLFARAGTTAPYLLRSHDDGAQWESLSDFDVCTFMAFSPQGRIFFFPAEFADVYYSDDNCLSWYNTSNHSVENYQMSGARAVSNDTLLMWGANQLDYTLDGGLTWLTTHPAVVGNDQIISDMLVNQNGDVYISVYHHFLPDGIGVYHATLSDMQNWELVAFEGLGIMDMEFDPEGNVLCGVYFGGEFSGFEHTPGFYAFNARNFGVADNGIIYKMDNTTDNTVVLAYSHDHGQTFTVTCAYQLYPTTKWYGTIEMEDDSE